MSAPQIISAYSLEACVALPFIWGKAGEIFLTLASHTVGYAAAIKKCFKF